jgi:hypothetical protein
MSTSLKRKVAKPRSARQTGGRFRLTVRSNADTEIFVIDGSLGVRHCAVGFFSKILDSGLYKVRVVRGGGNREQLVDLDRRREVALYCETFPAIAPIGPMLGTAAPQVEALARLAIERHRKWPAEGILVLAHGENRPRAENERLLHDIALRRWDDPTQQFAPAAARPRAAINGEDWQAHWWPAEPGCYVLGYPDGTQRAEQALLVAKPSEQGKKWQTRVFLRETSSRTGRETSSRTGRRVSSSIQMARYDSKVVYRDHYETIETARNALENERPIVSEWLINNLLYGKFENPVMGLVGLHLFLSALEDARAGKRSAVSPTRLRRAERDIDVVLGNLEKLLGGRPSDLIALQVRAGRLKGAHVVKVIEPPMFWKSWDVLRQNTDEGEPVVIDRDFWNRISLSGPAGPYFAWQARADATTIPARYALPFELLREDGELRIANDVPFAVADSPGGRRVLEMSPGSTRAAPALLSVREMARTLGIPLSALADPHGERVTARADREHWKSYPIVCTPKSLPRSKWVEAARKAVEVNPANQPPSAVLAQGLGPGSQLERIAVMIAKRWPAGGVRLTVGFLDNPPADLRARIISHMNAWAKTANVQFTETKSDPQVRIARASSPAEVAGYWSYLGTDILSIPANEPTMNLELFTMNTPDSEFHRVVRHETGHTLGFPHEHLRRELVNKIDPDKAIAFFGSTQGWTPEEVRQQVLTPLEDSSLLGTTHADAHSIMCYQIPGSLTKDGKPIVGGLDIDSRDYAFAKSIYPKEVH